MDPGFQPGEIVDVTIRGLRIESVDDVGMATFTLTTHMWRPIINLRSDAVKIDRVTPADGEPQPGELWADQAETLYVARKDHPAGVRLVNVDKPGSIPAESWESVHGGPLGPIYRVAQRPLIGGQS